MPSRDRRKLWLPLVAGALLVATGTYLGLSPRSASPLSASLATASRHALSATAASGENDPALLLASGTQARADSAATSTKTAMAAPVKGQFDLKSVEDALRRDDLCYLVKVVVPRSTDQKLPTSVMADLVFQNPNPNARPGDARDREMEVLARALLARSGADAYAQLASVPSEATDLYRAALLGNMLEPLKLDAPSPAQALALLDDLHQRDPANGAILFVELGIKAQQTRDFASLKPLIVEMLRAPRFEAYSTDVSLVIMEHAAVSSSYFIMGVPLEAGTAILRYDQISTPLEAFLKEQGARDRELSEAAIAFGRLLMAPAIRNAHKQHWVFWSPIEYTIGRNKIAKPAWNALYPGRKLPDDLERNYDVLLDKVGQRRSSEAWDKAEASPEGQCDRADMDSFVISEREVYRASHAKF